MKILYNHPFSFKVKSGISTNINTNITKALAIENELHYAKDIKRLYIFDGTQNIP